ncbi:hypothetical protein LMIY3S_01733 [Labrys miyagiensis]
MQVDGMRFAKGETTAVIASQEAYGFAFHLLNQNRSCRTWP